MPAAQPQRVPSPDETPTPAPVSPAMGAVRAAPASLGPGHVIAGRYRIVQLLGEGGMGAVYKAEDLELERDVALKVIRPELAAHAEILQRFKHELVLSREVTHRNIVRIYDLGEAEGLKFITMEFVAGEDLRTVLRDRGKLSPKEAVVVFQQILRGLLAAHKVGVIHRDLKPANIMRDNQGRVVVMDFGLARSLDPAGSTQMTQSGAVLGTLEYMSPEQAKGKNADVRSDLFTAGLIFYELLTGEMPFKADSAIASLLRRTQERAPLVSAADGSIPSAVTKIVAKCLEPEPGQRYQSAAEILDDLETWNGKAPHTAFRPSRIRIGESRNRWPVALATAAAVVVVAASAWFLRGRLPVAKPHAPVSLLVSDFENKTGDSVFDGTVEPAMGLALEGAAFIGSYDRGNARKEALKLQPQLSSLDLDTARLVATRNAIDVVVGGTIERDEGGFRLTAQAVDAMTGRTIAERSVHADTKDAVLKGVGKLAAGVRSALGDTTPESVQLAAAETFSAGSLEAAHQYALAQQQLFGGKSRDALPFLERAVALDPRFGRAYSVMAAAYRNLGEHGQAVKYFKLAMENLDRMTDRERYRTRGAYYVTTGEYQKCIDEYSALIANYPADNVAHMNIAVCFARMKDMPHAMAEAKRAVEVSPKAAQPRMNLSLYAAYAGDFATSEREGRETLKLNPSYDRAYLALAYAQIGQGQTAQAVETYRKLAALSATGKSYASAGLADIALYEGRFHDAARMFEQDADDDLAGNRPERAAANFAALAYTQQAQGKRPDIATIDKALANGRSPKLRFLAGRLLIAAGAAARAREIAAGLASEPLPEPQSYARILEGEALLQAGNTRDAIKKFSEANAIVDNWIGRFDLGRAYLEAGMFVEADSEFDRCLARRGEAMELFVDDAPTYGYFPPVYYYLGRVRESMKTAGYADSYRSYLGIRSKAGEDPLLNELQQRAR